jgi:23S rRNA A1618 N6-methylase RlmF
MLSSRIGRRQIGVEKNSVLPDRLVEGFELNAVCNPPFYNSGGPTIARTNDHQISIADALRTLRSSEARYVEGHGANYIACVGPTDASALGRRCLAARKKSLSTGQSVFWRSMKRT